MALVDWLIPPSLIALVVLLATHASGFPGCLAYLLLSTLCIALFHVRWMRHGSMNQEEFAKEEGRQRVLFGRFCCLIVAAVLTWIPYDLWGIATFCQFTSWTWLNMNLYFAVALFRSFRQGMGSLEYSKPHRATLLWFQVLYGMAWLVDIFYWFLLVPFACYHGNFARRTTWLNIWLHSLNVLVMNVELLLSQQEVRIFNSIFGFYFGMPYICFNWMVHSLTGNWTYFFLDYSEPFSVYYLLLLQVVVVLSFALGSAIAVRLHRAGHFQEQTRDRDDRLDPMPMQIDKAWM
ncbi:unnamed protein product [Effrenium voratum]|nr:unnamed protein product [Effrenium voratum]